jgi:hypothetical protein
VSGHSFFFFGHADLGFFTKRWQGVVIKLRDVDVSLDADHTVWMSSMFDVKDF